MQERQDTPDNLELLPKVGLEDVPADLHIVQGQLREIICNRMDTPLNLYHAEPMVFTINKSSFRFLMMWLNHHTSICSLF